MAQSAAILMGIPAISSLPRRQAPGYWGGACAEVLADVVRRLGRGVRPGLAGRPVVAKARLLLALVIRVGRASDVVGCREIAGLVASLDVRDCRPAFGVAVSEFGSDGSGVIGARLERVEKTMAAIEGKLDRLLLCIGGRAIEAGCEDSGAGLVGNVNELREMVGDVLGRGERVRADAARKGQALHEMAAGADRFLAGVVARIAVKEDRELFFLLVARQDVGGTMRPLTFQDIGMRLGGLSKQAAHARAKEFRRKYPAAWEYVTSIRKPGRPANFSELSPSERRAHGIDKCFDHEVE